MKNFFVFIVIVIGYVHTVKAQLLESFVHKGEVGVSAGVGHYFGDLNNGLNFNAPKFSAALHYTKQFNNYVGLKISGTYSFLGYSDIYSSNAAQRLRNLSFNSDIWELSASGLFNFFKFVPGFEGYNFTPYMGIGVGVFSYEPYTYLNDTKYLLRNLGTEGQGSAAYKDRKPYSNTAYCLPITLGAKHAINRNMNVFAEIKYRFTNTDYLDDVSTTYAPDAFTNTSSPAYLLQDRSYELNGNLGIAGRQRGNSLQNDAFATFHIGVSFNIQAYECPKW